MANANTANTQQAIQNKKLTATQRAILFDQSTRQYLQNVGQMTFSENDTVSTILPKSRFLSKISLLVQGTFKLTHATKTTFTPATFDIYNLLRQVRLSINNGFNPYQISGPMLALYNQILSYKNITDNNNLLHYFTNTVSPSGAVNTISMLIDLPLTVNERDTIGLILLQNSQTSVQLDIDCNTVSSIMTDTDITIDNINITITPILETYSIPPIADAIPDYSIIKIVNQQIENIMSAGQMTIKLPVGLTYRKLAIYLASDNKFTPISSNNIGNIQLVFNQADIPYSIPASYLQCKNTQQYGKSLPQGAYVFDFSDNGIVNYGSGRDYIDTEKLTEFWLTIDFKNISGSSNYVHIVSEKLAKLS